MYYIMYVRGLLARNIEVDWNSRVSKNEIFYFVIIKLTL